MENENHPSLPMPEFEPGSDMNVAIRLLTSARKIEPFVTKTSGKMGFMMRLSNPKANLFIPEEIIGVSKDPDTKYKYSTNIEIGEWSLTATSPDENTDLYTSALLAIAFGAKLITYDEAQKLAREKSMKCLDLIVENKHKLIDVFLTSVDGQQKFREEHDLIPPLSMK